MNRKFILLFVLTASGFVLILPFVAALQAGEPSTRPAIHVPHNELKKLAWQLAIPTSTFSDKTVFEAIDLLHAHDIHHLELAPGQILDAAAPAIKVDESMPENATAALLAKLKSVHMDIVTYGPVEFGPDDHFNRAIFVFAKKIKTKNLLASVATKNLEQLDKLATEFEINLAIQDQKFSTPAELSDALKNLSQYVGSDGDFDRWPEPVKALQTLNGHLIEIRARQITPDLITELKNQHFKGVITIAVTPGPGSAPLDKLIESVNQLSETLQGNGN